MILPFEAYRPRLGQRVYVAPSAAVIGNVELADDVSVWFSAVLRADVGGIRVGARSNIQDGAVLHMAAGLADVEIGTEVTIGHGAMLHSVTLADRVLVGIGAVLLDGVKVGAGAIVGAGALLPPGFEVPEGMLALGSPAKVVRPVKPEERLRVEQGVQRYLRVKAVYAANAVS